MRLVKIIDNNRKSLKEIFKDLEGVCEELSIATGYWDLSNGGNFTTIKKVQKNKIIDWERTVNCQI